jgi:microcin C transport system substrate-binding protein
MRFTRREFMKGALGTAVLAAMPRFSLAGNPAEKPLHGLSAFGDLKYSQGFTAFDYASIEAPKGGAFAFAPSNWGFNQNTQTFNTLNTYVLQGEAPPRMELCFDTLMAEAWDEPDSLYGLLAASVTISPDRNTYRFDLRPEARFHDGTPVTPEDMAWSLMTLKELGHPQLALDLVNLDMAEAFDEHVLELRFNGKQSDRAILSIAATAPALSKSWYDSVKFEEATTTAPLSSGPYRVKRAATGQFIEYEKVSDYWGRDLPVMRGLDHFDVLRIDFFQERQAAFEAFKKGEILWRQEFTSKTWATEYDFPAVRDGRVKKLEFTAEKRPQFQAFALNTRREKFANAATRQAIGILFDFEWANRNLFFGAYKRSHSLFERSDFVAKGSPGEAELALLEPLRDKLPPQAFGPAVMQNVTDGTGRDRSIFRKADKLLQQAGWTKKNGQLVDANGRQLAIEVLIDNQVFERILSPFGENLRAMGIAVSLRQVDPSQYQSRIEARDFDMMMVAYSLAANPDGETLRRYFHSESADRNGTENHPGAKDPAIDALVEQVGRAASRAELVTAMLALDRALRANHYWIPNWHAANHRVACWDVFGWKEPKPDYSFAVERLWWRDPGKKTPHSN